MGRFSELTTNKEKIIMRLIESQNIIQALANPKSNFLDEPITIDPVDLIYQNIFPYRFIPTTQTEEKTFITMKFSYKPNGMQFKNSAIYFYVITHKNLIRTDYGLRYDYLINQIDELFNSEIGIGISKLPFHDMDEFVVDSSGNYVGQWIAYKSTEFN